MSGRKGTIGSDRNPILPVGGNNYVASDRVLGVFEPDTAAVKRLVRDAKNNNKLIDVSRHREVRSVLILDTGDVVTSFLTPDQLAGRFRGEPEAFGE
jgi:regulator of extracellular matrix RemA (YlzA/DUF370 family)